MAALREVPFGLYYGSVDSTPLFVLLAGLYAERTGDDETLRELWPAIEAGLAWIDGPGDPDGDGFVEYYRKTAQGPRQPGLEGFATTRSSMPTAAWPKARSRSPKCRAMCSPRKRPRRAARCGSATTRSPKSSTRRRRGSTENFDAAFWCPEIGMYALALDGAKQPCAVRTSNAGQTLFTGIAREDRARAIASELLGPRFFSGWGIRTVARGEARYNPMSYHNGSIWPHDNALIALGFARYGLNRAVAQVSKGLFECATYMDLRRLPELFCGFQRERRRGPTLYPVACAPQAWASATPFSLIQASLGLEFAPQTNEIRLSNPYLPPFLDEIIAAQPAARRVARRSQGAPSRRRGLGGTFAHARQSPGLGGLFALSRNQAGRARVLRHRTGRNPGDEACAISASPSRPSRSPACSQGRRRAIS